MFMCIFASKVYSILKSVPKVGETLFALLHWENHSYLVFCLMVRAFGPLLLCMDSFYWARGTVGMCGCGGGIWETREVCKFVCMLVWWCVCGCFKSACSTKDRVSKPHHT